MNKAELVEALAQHYEGSKAEATKALNAVVQTITYTAAAGEKVAITGFGVFEKVQRPARTVRNPRTGERKEAPATAVPRFRAGTELKAYVAGQRELPELTVGAPVRAARPVRTSTRASTTRAEPAADQQPLVPTQAGAGSAAAGAGQQSTTKRGAAAGGKKSDAKATGKSSATKAVANRAEPKKAKSKKAVSKKTVAKKADTSKGDAKKSGKKADAKKGGKKGGKK